MVSSANKYYTAYVTNAKKGTVANIAVQSSEQLEIKKKIFNGELNEYPAYFNLHSCFVTDRYYEGDITDDEPEDYLVTNMTAIFMSERLKDIISSELKDTEKVRWIKADIRSLTKTYTYYAMLFTEYLDIIDTEKTMYVEGVGSLIVNPFYKQNEAEKYAVFHKQSESWQFPSSFSVNEAIKKKIKKAKITGITLELIKRIH